MKEQATSFFDKLNKLGTGERASLKRCAGRRLNEADGKSLTVFYRCLPKGVKDSQEERWFAIACLRCLWNAGETTGTTIERIIGDMIRTQKLSDSIKHRMEGLLDTPWDSDGYMLTKLTRIVKLLRQKGTALIDFNALLEDLIYWNSDNKDVQKKWAKAIFAPEIEIIEE